MMKIFMVILSTVLALGSELGSPGCQPKEIYKVEKQGSLCYYLKVSLWAPGFLTLPKHMEVHSESHKQTQVALIPPTPLLPPWPTGSAQELVRSPQLNTR